MTNKKYKILTNFINISFPIVFFFIVYAISEFTIRRIISADNIMNFVFLSIMFYHILKQILKLTNKYLTKQYLGNFSNK